MREFHARLRRVLGTLGRPFEIVYVNDGSTDGTLDTLLAIYEEDPSVGVVVDLFRNSGSPAAVAAGCVAARGRHFIFIDSDLQLDPEDLPRLVREFDEGVDLVNGVRRERRDSWARRAASKVFNVSLRRMSGARALDLGCTFKVVRGELVRGLAPGPSRVLNPVFLAAAARDCANVPVAHHPRRYGSSGWTLSAFLALTADTVLGLSRLLFQVLSLLNVVVASGALVGLAARLLTARVPVVTTRTLAVVVVLGMSAIFGVVCVVGEYVLRARRAVDGPPRYIVRSVLRRAVAVATRDRRQVG